MRDLWLTFCRHEGKLWAYSGSQEFLPATGQSGMHGTGALFLTCPGSYSQLKPAFSHPLLQQWEPLGQCPTYCSARALAVWVLEVQGQCLMPLHLRGVGLHKLWGSF